MIHILITGANSYIGTSFEKYIKTNFPDDFTVDTIDMTDSNWKNYSFSNYDCILHTSGIAHQKETVKNADLYYRVNRDIAFEAAKKAKAEGVKQFIFLSTMSVYGADTGVITKKTEPKPKTHYGKSKLEAEEKITQLKSPDFKVARLRPPMVYGKNCKGNFQTMLKLIKKSPVFPNTANKRSMIYIDNLVSFIKLCIDRKLSGLYFPQNSEYIQTSKMAEIIAQTLGKKLFLSYTAGLATYITAKFCRVSKKAFGTLIYKDTEDFEYCYCVTDNTLSVRLSVE